MAKDQNRPLWKIAENRLDFSASPCKLTHMNYHCQTNPRWRGAFIEEYIEALEKDHE
jgi:hypothetical protein